jgi:GTP-binding protein
VGTHVHMMSGASGEGTTQILRALQAQIDDARAAKNPPKEEDTWRP